MHARPGFSRSYLPSPSRSPSPYPQRRCPAATPGPVAGRFLSKAYRSGLPTEFPAGSRPLHRSYCRKQGVAPPWEGGGHPHSRDPPGARRSIPTTNPHRPRRKAIALCPGVAVYWVNRGLCHFRRKDWARVEEDSRRALALDDASVKGHYLLGCALLEKEECALAVKEFEKALDLLKSSNSRDKMVEDIWQVLTKAKYQDWEKHSTQRVWKMQSLREACENALQEHHFLSGTLSEDSDGRTNEYSEQCKLLSEVFTNAILADTPGDVPDYLCCQITFEIFRDPVITPSGVTYERAILLEHLRKVGKFDPVTREPLKEHQLVPNLAIKEAVQAYLKEHSWAYKSN